MKKIAFALFAVLLCMSFSTGIVNSQTVDDINKKTNRRPPKPAETPGTENDPNLEIPADPNAESDDELLKIDTEVVTTSVKVTTRGGSFVSGLTKDDFQVFEDKVEQEIAFFSDERQPFTVALVLDMSYSSTFKISEIQFAAMEFVNELKANDKVLVISFDQDTHVLSEATSDRQALQRAIYSTKVGSGTSLYDTIDFVINKRLNRIQGRKAIVLFTDGVDTTSRQAYINSNLHDALEYDALIYPIQYDTYNDVQRMKNQKVIIPQPSPNPIPSKNPLPFPLPTGGIATANSQGTSAEEYQTANEYLNQLANRTNGRLFLAQTTTNLSSAFSKIAEDLRAYYSLGYYPKEKGNPGEMRKMKVKVKRSGVSVRARESYFVRKPENK